MPAAAAGEVIVVAAVASARRMEGQRTLVAWVGRKIGWMVESVAARR
jgi:hypothetical protein